MLDNNDGPTESKTHSIIIRFGKTLIQLFLIKIKSNLMFEFQFHKFWKQGKGRTLHLHKRRLSSGKYCFTVRMFLLRVFIPPEVMLNWVRNKVELL